jgi:pantothenate kinase-related protein Tda10
MEKAATFSLEYTASPVCAKFHNSEAFVRGIKGPIGSGKSVACCIEFF